MLIVIPANFASKLSAVLQSVEGLECFDNLAIAYRKGIHLLSGSSAVLRRIGESMNGDASGVFRKIAQHHHEQSALIAATTEYILLQAESDVLVSRQDVAGRIVYSVSFKYFSKYETVFPARIVTEDATDKDIYIRVVEGYLFKFGMSLRGVRCNLQAYGGGGSSTADQFQDHAAKGPTIAIVDSDMRSPNGSLGNTARAVLSKSDALKSDAVCNVEILPAHELENLLPSRVLVECLAPHDDAEFRARWLNVASSGALSGSVDVRYLDLKSGIEGRVYYSMQASSASTYIESAAQRVCSEAIAACNCSPREACSCVFLHGIGATTVRRVGTMLAVLTPQKVAEYFFVDGTELQTLWIALAKRLVSWGFASTPSRT